MEDALFQMVPVKIHHLSRFLMKKGVLLREGRCYFEKRESTN